ncbi:MAG: ADP-ribosylglycohydrolase family protein [Verrucomicrobiota bacterium]
MSDRKKVIEGVIWGTAVGDSLGLPAEGVKPVAIEKLGWRGNWKHRFIFGKGMLSDDTEHTLMVAEALSRHSNDVDAFRRYLASRMRMWFLALPAGIGMATARSLIKLCIGVSSKKSGVCSAGNGPAMRSAIIGAYFTDQPENIESFVEASTHLTHTDPKALVGALAIAYCAAHANSPDIAFEKLKALSRHDSETWPEVTDQIQASLDGNESIAAFYAHFADPERGVSGYIYHTVPIALYAWLKSHKHNEAFDVALTSVLDMGGDTDTTGAIAGSILGASHGEDRFPKEWIFNIRDWPRSKGYLAHACDFLENGEKVKGIPILFALIRNLVFLIIVLLHGFSRLLPVQLRKTLLK